MKTLVVEDDNVARELLRKLLTDASGCAPICAENATEGWQILINPALHLDLALIDIVMPDHDGFWLLQKVKELSYRQNLVLGICSANKDTETITRARAAGIKHYLLKPFAPETLRAKFELLSAESVQAERIAANLRAHHRWADPALPFADGQMSFALLSPAVQLLHEQLQQDYQGTDVSLVAVKMTAFALSADRLGLADLATMLRSFSHALDLEGVARTKLRSALERDALQTGLRTLHAELTRLNDAEQTRPNDAAAEADNHTPPALPFAPTPQRSSP
ncbi:MAG: response regulator [Candidatus Didemnitutus sp.]|nr:response regulator [Candidatus Didemnitutus sp.]